MGKHTHARYTDAEAVSAMGAKGDANPLHHDKAAEWGATEHTAIGDNAPHHARYTNAEALAAAIAGGLNKIVWRASVVSALIDSNRTTTSTYADLDLTAHTSADAKFALLLLEIHTDSYTSGRLALYVRPNDGGAIVYSEHPNPSNTDVYFYVGVICACDAGQVIEWIAYVTGTAQADFRILVMGYIE